VSTGIILTSVSGGTIATAWAYSTFAEKGSAEGHIELIKGSIEKRLDRIDDKLDALLAEKRSTRR